MVASVKAATSPLERSASESDSLSTGPDGAAFPPSAWHRHRDRIDRKLIGQSVADLRTGPPKLSFAHAPTNLTKGELWPVGRSVGRPAGWLARPPSGYVIVEAVKSVISPSQK